MSGNNSYIKSMNGIVSFDSGGTTIDGDTITTETVDCTTLNATDVNATGSLNTSYIFVDFMDKNIGNYITFISDVLFDYKLFVSSLWPSTGSNITVNCSLTSTSFKTESIEGLGTNSTTKQLKIGQDNNNTTSINIGRAAQTILGTVYPAIPPRTTFYAVGDDDIVNKKYVDNVVTGATILSLTNIFTGASNTFNNLIKTSQIDSVTPANTYSLLTSHTSTINIGTASSAITLGSASAPVRTDYVPLINADICNKTYTDTKVSTGVSGLLASTNIWTSTSNTFNNAIRCAIAPSAVTDLCNKTYVDSVAGSLLLTATNLWTGASNTFENVVKFGPSAGFQISIFPSNIESKNGSDTVGIFNNITTGNIEIGKLMGANGGNINFMNNFKMVLSSGVLQFRSFAPGDMVSLFSNLTNGDITIGGGQTNGDINIGNGNVRTTLGAINIGAGAGATLNPINIGGAGKVSIGTKFFIGETLANINYNVNGGAVRTITVPSTGVFMYVFGANYNDANITATTFVSAGSSTCRLFNVYAPPGFSYSFTPTGNQTFTISAGFPAGFNTFSVSYIKLG